MLAAAAGAWVGGMSLLIVVASMFAAATGFAAGFILGIALATPPEDPY